MSCEKKKAHVDACFEYAFSSGEPVLAGGGRDAGVDSSGSFSFPMLLLSMMAELGPSTIGIGTNNIGTNVACLGSFPVFNHVTSVAADERKAGRAASGFSCDLFQLLCNPS